MKTKEKGPEQIGGSHCDDKIEGAQATGNHVSSAECNCEKKVFGHFPHPVGRRSHQSQECATFTPVCDASHT